MTECLTESHGLFTKAVRRMAVLSANVHSHVSRNRFPIGVSAMRMLSSDSKQALGIPVAFFCKSPSTTASCSQCFCLPCAEATRYTLDADKVTVTQKTSRPRAEVHATLLLSGFFLILIFLL